MSTAEVAVPGSPAYLREARKAKWLSWASLAYMALEGTVAVVAGIVAEAFDRIVEEAEAQGISEDRVCEVAGEVLRDMLTRDTPSSGFLSRLAKRLEL